MAVKNFKNINPITLLLEEKYASRIEHVFYWRMIFTQPFIPNLSKFLNFIETNCLSKLKQLCENLTDEYDGTDEELELRTKYEFSLMNYLHMLCEYNYFDKDDKNLVWSFLKNILKSDLVNKDSKPIFFTGITESLWPAIGKLVKELFHVAIV